jgi:hypothetical protein
MKGADANCRILSLLRDEDWLLPLPILTAAEVAQVEALITGSGSTSVQPPKKLRSIKLSSVDTSAWSFSCWLHNPEELPAEAVFHDKLTRLADALNALAKRMEMRPNIPAEVWDELIKELNTVTDAREGGGRNLFGKWCWTFTLKPHTTNRQYESLQRRISYIACRWLQ